MKVLGRLILAAVVVFVLLQFVRPGIPSYPAITEIQAPPEIRHILETHCYACHSDQPRLSWFDQIVPGYWLVRHDILTARRHLDFSTLGSKPVAVQRATLYEAVNMVQLGAMPLPRFLALHHDARMSSRDLDALKAYLAPFQYSAAPQATSAAPASGPTPHTDSAPAPAAAAPTSLAAIAPEPGGFAFDPSFEGWKLLSTTDRGDNDSLRLVLGNGGALQAAHSGSIPPWPDGARFAKIAWQQQPGADGLIHPGHFIQVELMDKNAAAYSTDGWGWGRWRGLNLKPYGAGAEYTNECTGCHQPVHGNDFVYTLPISTAKKGTRDDVINFRAADLPAGMPDWPLDWAPITLYVDPHAHTKSVLFGNAQAAAATHPHTANPATPSYPAGSVLALVTWVQRDDPHWFGARIPDAPESVEFVQITAAAQPIYRRFSGAATSGQPSSAIATQRTQQILALPPASLP